MKRPIISTLLLLMALAGSGATAAAADVKVRTVRLGYALTETSPQGVGALKFAELVARKSGGKFNVQTFGNAVLGDDVTMQNAVQGGVLDMTIITTSTMVGTIKELGVLDIPFLFNTPQEADAILDGPVGNRLMELMKPRNMVGLGWMEAGFRNITNSRRPIENAGDIKGLKLRTMQSKIFIDTFNALGANPVPLAFTELYTAMDTGAVDGAENSVTIIDDSKWYEVQKYITLSRHAYATMVLVASKKLWDSLSVDERKIFLEAGSEAGHHERTVNRAEEAKAIADLKKNGMRVSELSAAEVAQLRGKVKPVVDAIARNTSESLVAEINQQLATIRK